MSSYVIFNVSQQIKIVQTFTILMQTRVRRNQQKVSK